MAHHLIAAGFTVREVPPQLSRRERARSRRPGKSDPGDALAIARVTLREPDLPPVRLEDRSTELGLLADARDDLVHAQTRARNRVHAHLVVLLPGYGRTVAQLVSGRLADDGLDYAVQQGSRYSPGPLGRRRPNLFPQGCSASQPLGFRQRELFRPLR